MNRNKKNRKKRSIGKNAEPKIAVHSDVNQDKEHATENHFAEADDGVKSRHESPLKLSNIISISISVLAALFALCQARIAQDTEQRQLRAYVFVVPDSVKLSGGPIDGKVSGTLKLKNYGGTPGHDLSGIGAITALPVSNTQTYVINDSDLKQIDSFQNTFIPNVEYSITVAPAQSIGITEDRMPLFVTHRYVVVMYGTIQYMDVFDVKRWANFCFYFDSLLAQAQAHACRNHNNAAYREEPYPVKSPHPD